MKTIYNSTSALFVGLLLVLVISLCGNAIAAVAPEVATLEPIIDGLRTPLKMALDGDGSIYVADPRSGGVVVLNRFGVVVKVLLTARSISSVALLNENNSISGGKVLVALGDSVAVLDQDGVEVARLGSGNGQFVNTAGMAVAPNGDIYVVDSGAYNVKIFSPAGTYLNSFGKYGIGNGVFMYPTTVAVVSETTGTRIAVVDTMGGKVDIFTSSGVYTNLTFGTSGVIKTAGPLLFTYPSGVAFEYANGLLNRVYIADMFQGQVQAISSDKQFLGYVGSYGDKRGNLMTPSDLQFDPINKRLLVANGLSNIVSFGIDGGQNPVNSIPPALIIDQPVMSVSAPSVVLTGTTDIGCTLAASVNTLARVSAASFPSAMAWMIPVDGLIPGVNVISITAKNSYGTAITKTATIQYSPPNAVFSINSLPPLTSQSSVQLTGSVEPGSFIYIGNAATRISGQAAVSSSGSWAYTLALSEGSNTIDVTAARTGATPSFKNFTITLDTQFPIITVAAMSDGSSTANQVQNISGTVLDPHLSGVAVNGNPVSVHNSVFSYAIALVKGDNVITVTAGDSLGNVSSDTRTINFDPDFPKIEVLNPADGSYTNVQEIRISGRVDKVASVKVNGVLANTSGGLDWSAAVKLSSGLNEIKVDATDIVGHVSNAIRTIVYDAVAPNLAITFPLQDEAVKSPGMTIKGTVVDNTGIESIAASVNGVDKQVMLADGEFSLFADFTAEGTYTVAVTVTDDAGNVTTARRSVVYDLTPPMLTVDPVSMAYPSALTGTAEAGASVVVKDDIITGKVVFAGQKWSADLTGLAYDPATLVVEATDAAGNVSVARINFPAPDGDVDGVGGVTIKDALTILRLVVYNQTPTNKQLARGDIGPLLNGKVNPNGKLEVVDAILILRKALGLLSW